MLKFDFITELIHGLLKEEGKDFSLNKVRKLIRFRNDYLNSYKDDSFKWIKLPKRKNAQWLKEELEYRKTLSLYLKENFKIVGIYITNEIIDKVFSFENFILVDVGNVRSFYEMLELLKKKNISFEFVNEIKKWTNWKKTVENSIDYFVSVYGFYPNIMFANKHTFSQINFIVNNVPADRKKVLNFDEKTFKIKPVEKHKEISLVGIRSNHYFLRFIIDEEMSDKKFILYYHDGPFLNWDDDDDDDDKFKPIPPSPISHNVLVFS